MDTDERMDNIDFRMDLLRDGTELSQYLYDCKVTKEQLTQLYRVMDEYRNIVDGGEEVNSAEYETDVLEIVDNRSLDYHFCENFARLLWEDERYEEVFEALYGDSQKFSHLFKN
ncbi:hypothetical protein LXJ15735_35040 [Lacrimispora xylanolytica]|nr:hypothetical protein [Clostridiales bacterium]